MQPRPLDRSTLRALAAEAEEALAQGPHPERARLDAEALLLHIVTRSGPERNRAWLLAHGNDPATPAIGAQMRALVERRRAGEPIQYIVGETEFFGLPFRVAPGVLIPRPETEHLVEKVLELAARFQEPHIVDIGVGSGAISVALAHHLPQAEVSAIDVSAAALTIARHNAELNGLSHRIRFFEGDLLSPVAGQQFEIVVSNPPYVPGGDRASLAVEVRDHEPALALFAGDAGLDVYRRLIPAAQAVLIPGGFLALEIGYGQAAVIAELLTNSGFQQIELLPDLQNIPRVLCGQRPQ